MALDGRGRPLYPTKYTERDHAREIAEAERESRERSLVPTSHVLSAPAGAGDVEATDHEISEQELQICAELGCDPRDYIRLRAFRARARG